MTTSTKTIPPKSSAAPDKSQAAESIVISFEGLGLPKGLNDTSGQHWGGTSGARKKWRQISRTLAQATNLRVSPDCRAHVHWDVYLGSWRVRDEDNIRGGMKAVQDGLVDAGVVRGDSVWDIVTSYAFYPYGEKGFIITITELPDLPRK